MNHRRIMLMDSRSAGTLFLSAFDTMRFQGSPRLLGEESVVKKYELPQSAMAATIMVVMTVPANISFTTPDGTRPTTGMA
jgi:hypothetical protein